MKLKTLKSKYENKTRGGHKFKLLEYVAENQSPIKFAYKVESGVWRTAACSMDGHTGPTIQTLFDDLIPKTEPIEASGAEERGYIKGKQYEKERMIELLGLTK